LRFNIPFRSKRPLTGESRTLPREAETPGAGAEPPAAVKTRETVLAVLPNLIKPRTLGRRSVYTLVITERRLIFAKATPVRRVMKGNEDKVAPKGNLFKWLRERKQFFDPENYWEMDPREIMRQTLVNFDVDLSDVWRVTAKPEIPFVVVLEPEDLLKRDLDSEWDDIVHEMPDRRRKGPKLEFQEEVEKAWKLRIDCVGVNLSFLLDYDPRKTLAPFLADKIA
jgi:hypothetical protein